MRKDPRVYLAHILERAGRIEQYIRDGEEAFLTDPKTQDAVIRNFEVIGEAAKRAPDDYRARHPEIPWQLMAGFRDVLIHAYEGVDVRRIWAIATRDLPSWRTERCRFCRLATVRRFVGGKPKASVILLAPRALVNPDNYAPKVLDATCP